MVKPWKAKNNPHKLRIKIFFVFKAEKYYRRKTGFNVLQK